MKRKLSLRSCQVAGDVLTRHLGLIRCPNLYHSKPILIMKLDLEDLAEVSSIDRLGFVDRLVALLPGLNTHRCSRGYEGGFVERLREGTYFAHIIEHVALELSELAGIPV